MLCLGGTLAGPAWTQVLDRNLWWLCPADRALPVRPLYTEPLEPGSTEIRADAARIVRDGLTQFSGDVELVRDSRSISGELVSYDDPQSLVTVEGNATIWDAGLIWQGEEAEFNLDSDLGKLDSGNYWLTKGRGHGYAATAETDRSTNISVLRNVDYTTCPTDTPAWKFSAKKIRLDHDAGRGSALHTVLKVRGVPVFYFPYFTFPLDDRRKSGFLMPTFGSSNESGFDAKIPIYFNIAPNHDVTLTPRVLAKRGEMLGGEYRYLQESYNGKFEFEYLPNDKLDNHRDRSLVALWHEQFWDNRRARLEARAQNVSDAHYFEDFGRSLSVTSQRYLDRQVSFVWRRPREYYFSGIVQAYQQVDDSPGLPPGPYRRLPQFLFQTLTPAYHLQLTPQIAAQTTYFDRRGSVSGGRVDLYPSLQLPYYKTWLRITPRVGVRHTEYFLNNTGNFDNRESRTVPVFSLDSLLFAERRFEAFGLPMMQTLEPRAFYLYVPKVGQDDIPVFDSGQFDIAFRNLFLDNRFTGRDRIGDANQLALATTTRFLRRDTGLEMFRASIGQIYYFEDREVTLPYTTTASTTLSELVAEFSANLGNGFSARSILQYDPNDGELDNSSYDLHYRPPGTGLVLNGSYRRERTSTDIEQTDMSFRIPISGALHLLGRWNYSLQNTRTLELVGGFEYESCCWGLRFVGRRFIRNTEGEFDTGMFVQFEFKGLAGYGRGTESFLRKSIPGYESYF